MLTEISGVKFARCSDDKKQFVKATLQSFPVRLPEDYHDFLLLTNGGVPSPAGIWLEDETSVRENNLEIANETRSQIEFYPRHSQPLVLAQASLWEHSVFPSIVRSFLPVFLSVTGEITISSLAKAPYLNDSGFVSSLLPIAEISQLLVGISCHEATLGKVYYGLEGYAYLFEQYGDDEVEEFSEDLILLADSFTELLSKIVEPVARVSRECNLDEATIRQLGFEEYRIEFV